MILFSSLLFGCSDEEEAAEPAEEVVDSAEEVEDTSADSGEAAE